VGQSLVVALKRRLVENWLQTPSGRDCPKTRGTLLEPDLKKAIDAIYKNPLHESAVDILNFQLHRQVL
jgi:hypothetical protein